MVERIRTRPSQRRTTRRPVLLLVDDSRSHRATMRVLLPDFEVIEADSGHAAVQIIAAATECDDPIDVIVLDVEMPGWNGPRTYREIARVAPALIGRVGFMSAGSCDPELQRWCDALGSRLLLKGTDPDTIRRFVLATMLSESGGPAASDPPHACRLDRGAH